MNNTTTGTSPEALRASMVAHVKQAGHARNQAVEEALSEIPRHRFVPAATAEDAYANKAVITKRAEDGSALSCASVPTVVAMQLDQLDVQPGNRVLEIGAGTGYNAALLARLTGPGGEVTTVDIDDEVTFGAREALDGNGFPDVRVIARDGSLGAQEHAPYDRIILTVGAFDLPPAWWSQLAPGGRLVVPLRWRGQTRSVAFVREGDRLRSDSVQLCGFVPMIGQDSELSGHLDSDGLVTLYWDGDQDISLDRLDRILATPKTAAWSGVTVGNSEPFDGVWLRMTGTEPGTCRIAADPAAVEAGLATPAIPSRSPALVEKDSLAYFTFRRLDDGGKQRSELGAIGHGPTGDELAERLSDQIRAWGSARTADPVITAYPADTPDEQIGSAHIVDKRHSRLVVSLPVVQGAS
ncbi:methyltransferase, FxLD system [Amycolatopsis roodepoortensis]|uniref:Protein-L-isoaspartate O-methyltransferase n=1 Tax=Amycolatopsis roodepoortensis TaxID=700274 RepID=A0ABR9KZV5_9PSEU|nr:methyltransferase, FxLD system [Amycolatopsis roodepoortensis]MBE1573888.1 protein-L-isoaspartate(D-aspartate) O-methyltransferase [Amycolatopsis roodepoortensis]